ncbi:MAG: beta-N-acetylhexosaminidase [Clostridia bacterium]|nr:beta-N-acetylhexosaminidase [Clostridia bacterium]MBQ2940982.1 beta-N-acetylhexosaminidase [Clostridia bacterium]
MNRLFSLLCALSLCLCSCTPTENLSKAEQLLQEMSLKEKVYQMFTVSPEALTGIGTAIQAGDATRNALQTHPVGGIMYLAKNLKSTDQTREMLANTKSYSAIPPFLSVDEEGGKVARVADTLGTTQFSPMYTYRNDGVETAYNIGKTLATDIGGLGFNQNYAPVADLWTNPQNTVISTRAFGDSPEETGKLVAAAVKGMQEQGVIATLKHFPGHGDTSEDSHTGKAYSYRTLDQLRSCEFIPFQKGIDAGAEFVMCAHITVPEVDEVPATFSRTLIEEVLRGELGFDGVVITDALEMKAISAYYSADQAAVLAVQAGCDMLLCPADLNLAVQGLLDAVEDGTLTEERINQSVLRILRVKESYGLFK